MFKELRNQMLTGINFSPILYIPHYHYELIDDVITDITCNPTYPNIEDICEFDISLGIIDFKSKEPDEEWETTLEGLLKAIISGKKNRVNGKRIFVIKNANEILKSGVTGTNGVTTPGEVISLLNIFAQKYERGDYHDDFYTIILVSPEVTTYIPNEIRNIVRVIDVLPPTAEEIGDYLIKKTSTIVAKDKKFGEMVRTLQGLQMYEVKQTFRTALGVGNGRILSSSLSTALNEKQNIVKKSGIIDVVDPDVDINEIGGLHRLVSDLEVKGKIYENIGDALKYHIPIPKGILIIGMPGCGKSMIAKATAKLFKVSLLRLDVSRLMGKYVGESEANLRTALTIAEAAHPCVLWIDEIEKAFAGSNNANGDNDSLVLRMMGYFLTWMQERKTPVYIVATANDVMRPEFMRKGRFDDVYFVDFPNKEERAEILRKKILHRYPKNDSCLFDFSELGDCLDVVEKMQGYYGGFSGSEIECVLNMVVENKFSLYLNDKNKDSDFTPTKIKITKSDFDVAIERVKPSAMSNQKGKDISGEIGKHNEKTAIERIRDMQDTYHFIKAN